MAKGGQFERDLCKKLSLWWTNGERSDIFWRTSGSGARAKTRSKQGQRTFGQYGDIQATDPIGQPLIDVFTIEAKKGYNNHGFFDAVESFGKKDTMWEKFIKQAKEDCKNAGTKGWMLIWKRDRRKSVIWIPMNIYWLLPLKNTRPGMRIYMRGMGRMFCTTLDEFLAKVSPEDIKEIL